MKSKYTFIYFTFCFLLTQLSAQVGINTQSPTGVFDFRVAAGAGQKGISVGSDGKVIIGTSTSNPGDARLLVEGKVKIDTGNQGVNKYLVANAIGTADWANITLGSKISSIRLERNVNFLLTSQVDTNVEPKIITWKEANIPGITVNAIGQINVPAGKYLAFFTFDINGVEFGEFALVKQDNSDAFRTSYYGYLGGVCAYLDFSSATTLTIKFKPMQSNVTIGMVVALPATYPPANGYSAYLDISFLKLES